MANLLGGLGKLLGKASNDIANVRNRAIGNVVGGVGSYLSPVTGLIPRRPITRPTQYNPGQPPPVNTRRI